MMVEKYHHHFFNYFEWNNKKASNMYRLVQARHLINHIITVIVYEGKSVKQKSFYNVYNKKGERVYITMRDVVQDKDYRMQILNGLISTLNNAKEQIILFKSYEK